MLAKFKQKPFLFQTFFSPLLNTATPSPHARLLTSSHPKQNNQKRKRSAVLLGRMTTPDILASLQMPAVFEKMAMSYYKDATGFESDDSEEGGGGEGEGGGRRRRVSL